ncbi:helix-turn-helix transcriptional regulator [Dechloromonas sp. HYN0024]|uniref:helix-turn-helix transcriptional regulator n=1 Tax=Dechloromonas sp. HYN0024 TaxID=2231055 RepID=UPI000E435ADF|nr:helix-turn-helix transcriptional regulator [Dechloromonas sp. HYN0024]AXS80136.1 hypothetical protein HYN24_08955 [Dechloromonas sp. HYN0024]
MKSSNVRAIQTVKPMNDITRLSEIEQGGLLHAIETAIDVHKRSQFQAWMAGPFFQLLPHDSLVCIEVGDHGKVSLVEFLHHRLVDAELIDFLCDPSQGLAMRLIRLFRTKARMSYAVDTTLFESLLKAYHQNRHPESSQLTNAVVHRTRFMSGAAYFFILFNVPTEHLQRSPHLFKLLSSHLKMVLSRVIHTHEMHGHVSLTEREIEILGWMAGNKSNREIGVALAISPITVKTHVNKIFRKLDVQNRADAVSRGQAIFAARRLENKD